MTFSRQQELVTAGFILAYCAVMAMMIVAVSPHFHGIREITLGAVLGPLAILGLCLVLIGRLTPTTS